MARTHLNILLAKATTRTEEPTPETELIKTTAQEIEDWEYAAGQLISTVNMAVRNFEDKIEDLTLDLRKKAVSALHKHPEPATDDLVCLIKNDIFEIKRKGHRLAEQMSNALRFYKSLSRHLEGPDVLPVE